MTEFEHVIKWLNSQGYKLKSTACYNENGVNTYMSELEKDGESYWMLLKEGESLTLSKDPPGVGF